MTLTLVARDDSSTMTAILSSGGALRLRAFPGAASFRYVGRDSTGVRWLEAWQLEQMDGRP